MNVRNHLAFVTNNKYFIGTYWWYGDDYLSAFEQDNLVYHLVLLFDTGWFS